MVGEYRLNIANCKKKILFIWIAAFSALSSRGYALEESLSLLLTMAVGKTLVTVRQPLVEITSTKAVYLEEGDALPLPDTQCIDTGIKREQMCFGNNHPTRVRLHPDKRLSLGLSPQSISQLKYNASFPPQIPEPPPGQVIFPGFDPGGRSIITTLQQGTGRQSEIIETAKQNRRLWLLRSFEEHMDRVADEYAEEENEMIEWWMLEEVLYEANEDDDFNKAKIQSGDRIHEGIPLKPDTSYCITPPHHNKTRIIRSVPCDGESDSENDKNQDTRQENSNSEEDTTSDEKNDSDSKETVRSVANPDCLITNVEPGFEVAPEIAAYCDALEWAQIKQELEFNDEMPIDSAIIVTAEAHSTTDDLASPPPAKKRKLSGHLKTSIEVVHEGKKKHVCDKTGVNGQTCNKTFASKSYLKTHIETVHKGKKEHVCDRTGADGQPCNKTFGQKGNLRTHIEIVHKGKKEHVCDGTGANGQPCNKKFGLKSDLQRHMEAIHEGKKKHICDWTGANGQPCNQAFGWKNNLKTHMKIVHEGKKEHFCDWTGADGQSCNQAFVWKSHLKAHIEAVHKGKKEHICDRTRVDDQPCNQAFVRKYHLKRHIEIVHEGKKEHICDWTGVDGHPCNQAFGWKKHLKTHIETVHEGKKEHICDWTEADGQPCNQEFGWESSLKRHIESVHKSKKKNRKRPRVEEADDQTANSQ